MLEIKEAKELPIARLLVAECGKTVKSREAA